jgi:L-threonylcarbamoyladenylate synthase
MLPFNNDIEPCLEKLQQGGLILYPTDTVWGIGCDATNAEAVARIYALKKRADHKAMIVLVADERDILRYVTQPELKIFDYIKGVQRPTTVIYEGAIELAENLLAADGSVGIRICEDEFCKHLIKRFRKPLVSTHGHRRSDDAEMALVQSEYKFCAFRQYTRFFLMAKLTTICNPRIYSGK